VNKLTGKLSDAVAYLIFWVWLVHVPNRKDSSVSKRSVTIAIQAIIIAVLGYQLWTTHDKLDAATYAVRKAVERYDRCKNALEAEGESK